MEETLEDRKSCHGCGKNRRGAGGLRVAGTNCETRPSYDDRWQARAVSIHPLASEVRARWHFLKGIASYFKTGIENALKPDAMKPYEGAVSALWGTMRAGSED